MECKTRLYTHCDLPPAVPEPAEAFTGTLERLWGTGHGGRHAGKKNTTQQQINPLGCTNMHVLTASQRNLSCRARCCIDVSRAFAAIRTGEPYSIESNTWDPYPDNYLTAAARKIPIEFQLS